ncbi:sialidase family protein [Psychromicrobium lacuslunae]|uniref:sialidase family protein n=1 Tax=Psychromicrobium lacuslunae TaxID=1618207 RepID=UPI0006965FCF|nr:sialidase family protein [Psychromicrobium lacuslunae]
MAIVTGNIKDFGAQTIEGVKLTFWMDGASFQAGTLLAPRKEIIKPGGDGSFSVDLTPTEGLNPARWYQLDIDWPTSDDQTQGTTRLPMVFNVPASGGQLSELLAVKQGPTAVITKGDKGDKGDTGADSTVPGPANQLAIGTVTGGVTAGASITGNPPNQTLNLTLPKGDKGDKGDAGPVGAGVPTGGAALQVLRRKSDNSTTEWATADKALVGLSNVDNTTDINKPISVAQKAAFDAIKSGATVLPSSGTGTVRVGQTRVVPGIDSKYAAFPSATVLADGRIFLVWREGADHIAARDGVVKAAYSSDQGLTWTAATTIFTDPTTGVDLRDPTTSTSPDKKILYVTYIKGTASLNAAGFFLRISQDQGATWGSEIRIDPHPYSAGTAPIITLPNGNLLATWYGKQNTSDAKDSVFWSKSTNGGTTWGAPVKFADGVQAGTDFQEPYASIQGQYVVIMFRWGNADRIGITKSLNGGTTWTNPAPAFVGSGRPSNLITSNYTLICVYRNLPGAQVAQHGVMRVSQDLGATWTAPHLVERTNPGFWTYSGPVEVGKGQIFCPTTVEVSSSISKLSLRYLIEGGGISPYGDAAAKLADKALDRANTVAVADAFDRADGPIGQSDNGTDWVGTGPVISGGTLFDNRSDGFNVIYANTLTGDNEVEAEVAWGGASGVYLLCRVQDANNYLMFGIESNGANARLYKVVGGTATQLGTAAVSAPANVFHKLKVVNVGGNVRCYIEDIQVIVVTDSSLQGQTWVGLRTGVAATGPVHLVRNFIARRRGGLLS